MTEDQKVELFQKENLEYINDEIRETKKSENRPFHETAFSHAGGKEYFIQDSDNIGIIEWVTDNSFAVINLKLFTKLVLHKHCKHENISSFIRQLNAYGFNKEKTEEESKVYSSENFIRNNKNKLKLIKRFQVGHSQKQNTSVKHRNNIKSRALAEEFTKLEKNNENLRNGNRKIEKEINFINNEIEEQFEDIKLMCFDLESDEKEKGLSVISNFLGEKGKSIILSYIHSAMEFKKIEDLPESYSWLLNMLSGESSTNKIQLNPEISENNSAPSTFWSKSEDCPSLDINDSVYYPAISSLMGDIPLDLDDLLY